MYVAPAKPCRSWRRSSVRVARQVEGGLEVFELPLPAVVSAQKGLNEPRFPTLKGIMGAKSKPQETLSTNDLGLDADAVGEGGSRTEVYALHDPPARGDSVKIEDDGAAAQKIVDFLSEKKLV